LVVDIGERIFADFVTDPPYGVGWWAPHPGTSRRIFISDQLDACTTSVTTNMVEAALHWLELLDAIDHEDAFPSEIRAIAAPPHRQSGHASLLERISRATGGLYPACEMLGRCPIPNWVNSHVTVHPCRACSRQIRSWSSIGASRWLSDEYCAQLSAFKP
jgi:hypothetical protein